MQDVLWRHLTQLDAAPHMLQVLVSHFGLNNSRGVKLLRLCSVWRRCQLPELPLASCQLPVASGQLPPVGATSCHCCLLFPTCSDSSPAAKHCHSAHAKHPLHLHELPLLLSLFRLPLSTLCTPFTPICCCLIARKRQRNKKSNFPCGLIRFGVAISRCVIAKWLQLPRQDCARSHSQSWPKIAIFSYGGNTKKKERTKILI